MDFKGDSLEEYKIRVCWVNVSPFPVILFMTDYRALQKVKPKQTGEYFNLEVKQKLLRPRYIVFFVSCIVYEKFLEQITIGLWLNWTLHRTLYHNSTSVY